MRLLCDGMESSSSSSTFQLWIFLSDGCVQNKVLRSDFCILTGQNGTKLRIFFFNFPFLIRDATKRTIQLRS